MTKIDLIREKARQNPKKIVLPEGKEKRVIEAASIVEKEGIAKVILLRKTETHPRLEEIVQTFWNLRKHKGISIDQAREYVLKEPVYFAALMTQLGMADGFVAGASHTTPDVARAAIHCLKIDRKIRVVSSSFIIELENCPFGENGLFVFGDCGIVPNPTSLQLAGIALSSGMLLKRLFDVEPRAALLSYSTKGSAGGESVDKVLEALKIIREKDPDFLVDGELQLDAAIIPEVAGIKSPGSPVAGRANVLIFPNLDAGNISYKLIQRLGNGRVVGPILQGITKPASDLSRGCSVEEIVDAVAVTVVRAQNR
ncbi:MAG: phosphate acetyltransferase [Candidatus Omnitrophica bacterium]|nr:phosphate acetyltransferase [Candidatus Omnitrophota bacterium]